MLRVSEQEIKKLMRWPPHWSYDFANVVIVDPKTKKIFLSRPEDREEHTPYGGELNFGEQAEEGACREVIEETGEKVNPIPEDLILIKTVKVPPRQKIGGITRNIETFVYFMKDSDERPSVKHQQHEDGCRIVDVVELSLSELYQQIELGEIKLYSNFIDILPNIERCINEHL